MTREELVAEVTLRRKQLHDRARIADAIPHIIWTMNADGTPTYFNSKWTEYTGLDLEATLRVGAATLVHPEDLPVFAAKLASAQQTDAPFEVAYRLRRANDSVYRWHVARAVPLRLGGTDAWVATATDIDDERRLDDQQRFFNEAGKVLGTSLEQKQTLSDVARLVVPRMADWCAIDLATEQGSIERVTMAHVDPSKVEAAWEFWRRWPPKPEDPQGVYAVVRTGQPEVMREIPDEMLAAAIPDAGVLALIRSLGLRSSMCVPLSVGQRVLGALTLVSAESNRLYGPRDLAFATELAQRIGVAIENARLYGAAEQARTAAEAMAADVVEQSRAAHDALVTMRTERDAALQRLHAATKSG
jgi:PAS domain S-box-containing protein